MMRTHCVSFCVLFFCLFFWIKGDEEMMATDSSQLNASSHTSDELTELGKCLLKREVNFNRFSCIFLGILTCFTLISS